MNGDTNSDSLTLNPLGRWSGYFTGVVITIALLALAGWQWDIALLKRPIPGLTAMNPMTALVFLLSGFSLLLLTPASGNAARTLPRTSIATSSAPGTRWGYLLAIVVLAIALLRIGSPLLPAGWEIDYLLYRDRLLVDQAGNISNRMAVNTAFYFVFSSLSLLLLHTETRQGHLPSQFLALLTALLSLFSLIGYIYRVKEFYKVLVYIPMAVHTALCFFLLSLSLLVIHPRQGFMKDFTGPLTGSVMARTLIPFAILVPIVLGFLRLLGEWYRIFSVELGVAILVTSIIFFFLALIWYNTVLLNRRETLNQKITADLHTSEQKLSLLVDSIKGYAIFMLDPDGRIATWNRGAESIKGYTAKEIIGRPITVFYLKEEIEKGVPAYNLEMARKHGHFQNESWRKRKDGTRFWADVTFTALYDGAGKLEGFAKITRDMTERKRTQEKIAYQARLIEDTSDAILSTNSAYRIVSWNKAAEILFGYSPAEAIGQLFEDILRSPLSPDTRQSFRDELAQQGYWKGEIAYFSKNDEALTISLSISGIRDDQGTIDGYILACRDITDRIRAEQQLRKFNEELEAQVKEKTAELTGIFERVSDGFMAFDRKGNITYANKKAAEMNKKNPEDLVGRNFFTEFPSAATNQFGANFFRSVEWQINKHFEMYSPSLQLWIECYMYPSSNGLSLFFRDISDQMKTREMLVQSNTELRELASHLQDIREDERSTIAREIHDELGQQLTGIKMDLSWISKRIDSQPPGLIEQKVKSTLGLLDNTIQTVRRIATALRPSILDDLGLIAAIEWQSEEFEKRSGITALFHTGIPEMNFPPEMAIGLFRICQESLTNVARHARAKNVCLTLDCLNGRVILTITDDGVGLDPQKAGNKKTLGLLGMKERALMMGGELEITNGENNGLQLVVNVPLPISIDQ